MNRVHALLPLTEQEERVEDVLLQYGITHLTHAVFPVKNRMYVCDFYLPNSQTVVECWRSSSRRGIALVWIERNAAFIDLKFKRIKAAYPDVKTIALVEADQAKPELVKEYADPVLEHADTTCYTMEDFARVVRNTCRVGR